MTRLRHAVLLVFLAAVSTTPVLADPAPVSSLPWVVQGTGAVARAGNSLFFATTYAAVPRANQARGFAVFPATEGLSEPVDLPGGSDVYVSLPDGAGGWYVGGGFTTFGGLARRSVAHILANGRVDPAFVADLSTSGSVFAFALSGGNLIIGGSFTTVNAVARANLAYVSPVTGQVLAQAPGATGGPVAALAVSGNTLYVGGSFTQIAGQPRTALAALNASTGAILLGFAAGASGGGVATLAIDGTSLFAGGSFTAVNALPRNMLAKLDTSTGGVDPTWNPAPVGTAVAGIAVANGSLFVGGAFTTIGGQPRSNLGAVTTSGTGAATSWRADASFSVNGLVEHAGAIYVVGNFNTVGNVHRLGAAAVGAALPGTVLPWNPSVIGLLRSVSAAGGRIAVLGSFDGYGAVERNGLTAIHAVTGELLPFAPVFDAYYNVYAMHVSGSRLYVGGGFSQVNGEARRALAAFDLGTNALLPLAITTDGYVTAMSSANGVLYIGGSFTTVNGTFRLNVAAIDEQSGQLLPWNPQVDGSVTALLARNGSVLVAGSQSSIIGTNGFYLRTGLGEITSSGAVTSFNANLTSGSVYAMAASGGALFIGGSFATVDNAPRANAAAVNLGTGAVLAWNPDVNGTVIQLQAVRGFIYLGGSFLSVGGALRSRIARVRESDAGLSSWQTGFTPTALSGLAAFDDGIMTSVSIAERNNAGFLPEDGVGGAPGPPAEPAVRVAGSSVTLTWQAPVVGARPASYVLQAGTAPGLSNIATLPLSALSFSTAGVPAGTYYVRVRAVGAGGTSAPSREMVFSLGSSACSAPPQAIAPPVPTVTGSSIVLNWAPAPGAAPTGFSLQAGSSAGFSNIATLPLGAATTFSTSGVPAGLYFVRVVASNACGQAPPSGDALVRIGGAAGPPGAPIQLQGSAVGRTVTLTWAGSTGGTPATHVLEAGSGPGLANIATVTLGSATSFATAGVPPGTYYVRVRALNGTGASPASNELLLVVP